MVSVDKRESTTLKMTVISDIKVGKRLGGGNFSDVYRGKWQVYRIFVTVTYQKRKLRQSH